MSVLRRFAFVALLGVTFALPAQEARSIQPSRNSIQDSNDILESIYSDCLRKDSASCIKYKIYTFVEKLLGSKEQFSISEGVTVVRNPGAEQEQGAPRQLNGDEPIESLLFSRVQRFLETHTIKLELKGSDVVSAVASGGRALEDVADGFLDSDNGVEGRGKKKKAAKIIGPLLAALALKAAALLPLILGAIALIAGKALLIGKLALVLSAIIGLKKLLSQQKHVTYEVVAHPHHTSSHTSGHTEYSAGGGGGASGYGDAGGGYGGSSGGHGSGWGRAIDAQEQAYAAQRPAQ